MVIIIIIIMIITTIAHLYVCMYVQGVGHKTGPCTATFTDLMIIAHLPKILVEWVVFFLPIREVLSSISGWYSAILIGV
jgi:hypothetical protein